MVHDKEHLVGVSMTYDDHIVWISNYGRVGVVDKNITAITEPLQLPGLNETEGDARHYVTNSFAMDKNSGIYVVTSLFLCKVQWSSDDKSLKLTWASRYHDK
jgi:hypothetical protein